MLLMGSVVTAFICTTVKLVLIYDSKVVMDSCHGTFVSSRGGDIAVVVVELVCFVVLLLVAISVYIHKFKGEIFLNLSIPFTICLFVYLFTPENVQYPSIEVKLI